MPYAVLSAAQKDTVLKGAVTNFSSPTQSAGSVTFSISTQCLTPIRDTVPNSTTGRHPTHRTGALRGYRGGTGGPGRWSLGSSGSGPGSSSDILGFGYVRGYDSGFGPLQGSRGGRQGPGPSFGSLSAGRPELGKWPA